MFFYCYNVGSYLDAYFESIISQSLDFKKHIQIICVDDGSQDDTAEVIKRWQEKYPENIHYFYKENGGQASARNLGLEYVSTEWVTFIDPDDFLNKDYFLNLDRAIHKDSKMLVTNLIFWMEDVQVFKDTHPLKYRFSSKVREVTIQNLQNCINLSAASTVFKYDIIKDNNIIFDHEVKPTFEDGKFIADYMLSQDNGKVSFVKDSHYLYRKRENGTSTLDTAWKQKEKFDNVLSNGYLSMLRSYADKFGKVPLHIQRTVVYDIVWYVKHLLDNEAKTAFLSDEEKVKFHQLILDIFQYIDTETIMKFELCGCWWLQKAALISGFKQQELPDYFGYIEKIDRNKKQVLISYFVSPKVHLEHICLSNGQEILPTWSKSLEKLFVGKGILSEKRIWISYNDFEKESFKLLVDERNVKLNLKGKWYNNGISFKNILDELKPSNRYYQYNKDIWLLLDRDMQADDNAEHLYRYIKENYPEQEAYFALNAKSHDWERLKKEGFQLLDYGSKEFETVLKKSAKVISSHADDYIHNYFQDHYEHSKDIIFLQHGVTKDNLSAWLNKKKDLRCFITTTKAEYHSIADKNSPYIFSDREVALTGFPRHDALLKGNKTESKEILIMPTWRSYIVGDVIAGGFQRERNKFFKESLYYKSWSEFLASSELEILVKEFGFTVTFAPHANIEPYLDEFSIPDYIHVWKAADGKIQDLFRNAKFMITDYSSVAFEMAFLGKQVLYYQFDKELVFGGEHTYQKGYFSYEENGFGPVVENLEELLTSLRTILENNGEPVEPYNIRIEETFPFRDGKNCERVYQAIKALNEPESKPIELEMIRQYVQSAYDNQNWELLLSRCELLEEYGNESDRKEAQRLKLYALVGTYQFDMLDDALLECGDKNLVHRLQSKRSFMQEKWQDVILHIQALNGNLSEDERWMLLRSYAELHQPEQVQALLENIVLDTEKQNLFNVWYDVAIENWENVAEMLSTQIDDWDKEILVRYKPQLLLSRAYRMLGKMDFAHKQLVAYEKHTNNDTDCRLEIAHLAFAQNHYEKAINQLEKTKFDSVVLLPEQSLIEYLNATNQLNNDVLDKLLKCVEEKHSTNEHIMATVVDILINRACWEKAEKISDYLYEGKAHHMIYPLVLSQARQGKIDKAYKAYKAYKFHSEIGDDIEYQYWEIISELAIIHTDMELARYCLKNMITRYPSRDKENNIAKLISLSK